MTRDSDRKNPTRSASVKKNANQGHSQQHHKRRASSRSEISVRVEGGGCNYEEVLQHLRAEGGRPAVTKNLRWLFDEWVDTGLHANGEECPFKRNPNQTPNAIWTLQDFLKRNSWRTMLGSGAHSIEFPAPSTDTMLSMIVTGRAHEEGTKEYAAQMFIGFLGTPRCLRFMKCRSCSQYFELRSKPKRMYSGGWHCASCQKERAANRATLATKEARTTKRVGRFKLAVAAWAKWKEDSAEPSTSWVLAQATADNPHAVNRLGLKANWITLHRDEIRDLAAVYRK